MRILMVGLDAAGKTTILYKLKLGEGTSSVGIQGCDCGIAVDNDDKQNSILVFNSDSSTHF